MAREMKNSGVKWIGEIPSHWRVNKIGFIFKNLDYLREPISAEKRERNNPQYDYYGASGVIDKIDHYNVNDKVLLIGEDGANLVMRNLPLVYKAEGKFWVNNHAHILKPIKDDYAYMAHALEAADYRNHITGSAQPKLSQEKLQTVRLPLPPLSEQQAIADFLDAKCAEIDGLLADLDAEVKTLAEYKKSIIAETVTRGLNPNAPMKPSGIPWAETIPAHWEMFRLRFVVQIVSCYKNSSSIKVGLENIESWTGKYIPSETEFEGKGNYFGNNDILFGKLRPYLAKVYLAEFEGQAIGDFLVFRTKECAAPKYVKYFLLNPLVIGLINSFTYGAKMPRANWQDISKVFMPIPPIEEQEAIAAYLDEKCAIIDQSITDKQTQIETLKSYKSSLIYECVTGKKQVI